MEAVKMVHPAAMDHNLDLIADSPSGKEEVVIHKPETKA